MNIVERLISLLAPHRCIGCGEAGQVLCPSCRFSSLTSPPSRCYRCYGVSRQSEVCPKCRRSVALSHVWAASDYHDQAKELIRRFKFDRAKAAAGPVAAAIEASLPDLPPETLVSHIPTANSRIRVRGYDQAELIAKILAKDRGWQHQTLLLRRGSTRQVGVGRVDRFSQIESALLPLKPQKINKARILLVDDVTTTGATLEAAAKILKKAGAKSVDAVVFAQAV